MCGIAGMVLKRGAAQPEVAAAQLLRLEHRGPDSSGVFASGRAAIGQTRLAVIDLVTGDPPIETPDGSIGVVLNGEIYNYRELREALLRDGHSLRTKGDIEVIAHLAERDEPTTVASKLDGMFAFAIWDERRQRLVLGRDRFGKKPLYWWCDGHAFVFGSEIKAILEHPSVSAELDDSVIGDYLTFGYAPSPRTFFRGITSVPPGHVLTVDDDLTITSEPYWSIDLQTSAAPEVEMSMADAAGLVRDALRNAVEKRLVSDVPLGAFLSGGIDSSAVVALMSELSSRPVRTFTIGFSDAEFDERSWGRLVAERFGADHIEFVVEPDALALVDQLVWHHDQPFGDSSAIPTYLLSHLTREHVTVALCGDGGDELFAGYERFAAAVAAARYAAVPASARRAVHALTSRLPRRGLPGKVRRFERSAGAGLPHALREWVAYVPDDLRHELMPHAPELGIADYERHWNASAGAATLDRILLLNLQTYLLDDLLPKTDRMSMAHGLEVRAPFLDTALAELAFRIPPRLKAHRLDLKRVLKASMRGMVPDEVLDRPKKGFGVPLDAWFRGDLRSYMRSTLGAGASVRAHLAPSALDRILDEHERGLADHGHALWTFLTLELFLRRHGW